MWSKHRPWSQTKRLFFKCACHNLCHLPERNDNSTLPPKLTNQNGKTVNRKKRLNDIRNDWASFFQIRSVTCKRALLVQLNHVWVRQQILGRKWLKFLFTKEYEAFSKSISSSFPQILKVTISESDIFAISTFSLYEKDVRTDCWYNSSIIV